MLAINC